MKRTEVFLEGELILCCLRPSMDAETAVRMGEILQQELDWSRLIRAAIRHRAVPLLQHQLASVKSEAVLELVPGEIRDGLREHFNLSLRRSLILSGQLLKLLDAFQAKGIFVVPYKGPVLAHSLYGNLTLRQFLDLDILVAQEDAPRALDVLISLGYSPTSPLEVVPGTSQFDLARRHELALRNKPGTVIELHWRTQGLQFSDAVTANDLRGRMTAIDWQGRAVPMFASEDLLLVLTAHGVRHMWWRLHWLCDVARLLETQTMDWAKIEERARRSGELRRLLIGLHLTKQVLGAPIPAKIQELAEADGTVRRMANEMRNSWFVERGEAAALEGKLLEEVNGYSGVARITSVGLPLANSMLGGTLPGPIARLLGDSGESREWVARLQKELMSGIEVPLWEESRQQVQMRERLRDKVRYLWWQWLAPSEKELGAVKLPRMLRPLYVPMRIFRLMAKYALRPHRIGRFILDKKNGQRR